MEYDRTFYAHETNGRLSERQEQVYDLLQLGFSNNSIAKTLGISESTTKEYVAMVLHYQATPSRYALITPLESDYYLTHTDINPLTQSEREVLRLLLDGGTITESARSLNVSENTIRFHRAHVRSKIRAAVDACMGSNLDYGELYRIALSNRWDTCY